MTHVFVSPHPDDIALSCGGLIASLRELGPERHDPDCLLGHGGGNGDLSEYQRAALGFGNKANWPATEAFRRDEHRAPTTRSRPILPRARRGWPTRSASS